jgi:1-phosphofructokinase/tagatose 6-phosphate kinase
MLAADEGGTGMILTVTVNAAVDKTLTVANLQLGHRHRAQQGLVMAGGKGVNVARALKRLGEPVIATGLVGGHNGARILDEMTAEGILNDFVRIRGESRTSTVVVDPTSSVQTEIYEYGPEIVEDELSLLVEKLRYLSGAITTVVLGGSLPRKVPTTFYADVATATASRCAGRSPPSPPSSPRPSARPRRSSATSSRPTRTSSWA